MLRIEPRRLCRGMFRQEDDRDLRVLLMECVPKIHPRRPLPQGNIQQHGIGIEVPDSLTRLDHARGSLHLEPIAGEGFRE